MDKNKKSQLLKPKAPPPPPEGGFRNQFYGAAEPSRSQEVIQQPSISAADVSAQSIDQNVKFDVEPGKDILQEAKSQNDQDVYQAQKYASQDADNSLLNPFRSFNMTKQPNMATMETIQRPSNLDLPDEPLTVELKSAQPAGILKQAQFKAQRKTPTRHVSSQENIIKTMESKTSLKVITSGLRADFSLAETTIVPNSNMQVDENLRVGSLVSFDHKFDSRQKSGDTLTVHQRLSNVNSPTSRDSKQRMSTNSKAKRRKTMYVPNAVKPVGPSSNKSQISDEKYAHKKPSSAALMLESLQQQENQSQLRKINDSQNSNSIDKARLEKIINNLFNAADDLRDKQLLEDVIKVSKDIDPTPDLVEGIFYLSTKSVFEKCSNRSRTEALNKKPKIVVYDRRSLYLFDHETSFRKLIVAATGHNIFEAIIVLSIFLNSILLAIGDYNDRDNETTYNQTLESISKIFSYIFTLELILKVIAMGFFMHKKSYLRDPWNWLDFFVVLSGIIELAAGDKGAQSVRALRVLRVLRPLKSINAFPKMRRLIGALLSSLPNLGNAVCFMLFIFLLFGILGVQQFGGSIYQRCRFTDEPLEDGSWPYDDSITHLCSKESMGQFHCPLDLFCHSPLDAGKSLYIDDINNEELIDYGITVFDNLAIGLVTVFQMITLEGWTKIMYNMMDSNISWMAVIFSVLLVVIGSFFLLNVILAVLAEALTKVDEIQHKSEAKKSREIAQSLERRRKQQDENDDTSHKSEGNEDGTEGKKDSQSPDQGPDQQNEDEARFEQTEFSVPQEISNAQNINNFQSNEVSLANVNKGGLQAAIAQAHNFPEANSLGQMKVFTSRSIETMKKVPTVKIFEVEMMSSQLNKDSEGGINTISLSSQNFLTSRTCEKPEKDVEFHAKPYPDVDVSATAANITFHPRKNHLNESDGNNTLLSPSSQNELSQKHGNALDSFNQNSERTLIQMQPIQELGEDDHEHQESGDQQAETNRHLISSDQRIYHEENDSDKDAAGSGSIDVGSEDRRIDKMPSQYSMMSQATEKVTSGFFSLDKVDFPHRAQDNCLFKICFIICTHFLFTSLITLLIIANTACLAMDSYPRNLEREIIVNLINDIFSWCFVAEMIIKLLGLGFKEYARDTFNIFDATLVVISLIDFALLQIPQMSGGSGGALSAFRGIRLLRVFKLARSWTSFRELLHKIVLTVKEITTFSILLLICMFIFTLLGMELYGHKIKFDENDQIIEGSLDDVEASAPRPNFDNLYMAFTSIFIVFIGEDWQIQMHSHQRVDGSIALIFFPTLYIFLNLILLNLFLAILLQNFESGLDEQDKETVHEEKLARRLFKKFKNLMQRCCFCSCLCKRPEQKVLPENQEEESISSHYSIESNASDENEISESSDSGLEQDYFSQEQSQRDLESHLRIDSSLQKANKLISDAQPSNNLSLSQIKQQQALAISMMSQSIDDLRYSNIRVPDHDSSSSVSMQEKREDINNESAGRSQSHERYPYVTNAIKVSDQARLESPRADQDKSQQLYEGGSEDDEFQDEKPEQFRQMAKKSKTVNIKRTPKQGLSSLKAAIVKRQSLMNPGLQRKMTRNELHEQKVIYRRKKNLLKVLPLSMSIGHLKKIEIAEADKKQKKVVKIVGTSCGMFKSENRIRLACKWVLELAYFDSAVMSLIAISTILLTLDNPLNDETSDFAQILNYIDLFMTVAFTIECMINIIVYGFIINGPTSYLNDSWNVLDFLIVVFSLVNVAASGLNLEILKVFRMLRVLRPLRVLKRNFGLKIQVVSLLNSIPGVINLLAITMLLLMLFGIQGVNFFAGKMNYCNMDNMPSYVRAKVLSEWDCYDYGGEWLQYDSNFDNVGRAMLTMFTMMTTEGWTNVMWLAVDATEVHEMPMKDNQPLFIVFFILFLIFGSLFILNLFVGVVLNTFNLEKDKLSHNNQLTKLQAEYLEIIKNCYICNPTRFYQKTGNRFRDLCQEIAKSNKFNNFIMICIIFNSVCLSITWLGEPIELVVTMEWINIIFTIIYTLEMIIKMIAYEKNYFNDGWNVFDFLIVAFAWIGILSELIFNLNVGALTTVVRAFRILRVLKLIRTAKNLQKILNTFLLAIPELANVGALLFLFLFLFAVLGVFLFSGIRLQNHLTSHANFQNFGRALLTLFRITTGEGWQDIMYDCARPRGILFQCVESQTYEEQQRDGINGCGSSMALPYFVGFTLVVSLIFLNLFIAIILEGQLQATQQQEARVGEPARQAYQKAWMKYDPDATGMINIDDLKELIFDLALEEYRQRELDDLTRNQAYVVFNFNQSPQIRVLMKLKYDLPLNEKESKIKDNVRVLKQLDWQFNKYIASLEIPCYNYMTLYNFHDTLNAFVKLVFQEKHSQEFEKRKQRIEDGIKTNRLHLLHPFDTIKRNDIDYWNLELMEQEAFLEQDSPDFQKIIDRLETKGSTEIQILKLNDVRKLRTRIGLKVKVKIDQDPTGKYVMDSAQVIGSQRIKKFLKERKTRQADKEARISARAMSARNSQIPPDVLSSFASEALSSPVKLPQIVSGHQTFVRSSTQKETGEKVLRGRPHLNSADLSNNDGQYAQQQQIMIGQQIKVRHLSPNQTSSMEEMNDDESSVYTNQLNNRALSRSPNQRISHLRVSNQSSPSKQKVPKNKSQAEKNDKVHPLRLSYKSSDTRSKNFNQKGGAHTAAGFTSSNHFMQAIQKSEENTTSKICVVRQNSKTTKHQESTTVINLTTQGEKKVQQNPIVNVEDTDFDDLVVSKDVTAGRVYAAQMAQATPNQPQDKDQSERSGLPQKQASAISREADGISQPKVSMVDREDDNGGGMPNATDQSYVPGTSDIDHLSQLYNKTNFDQHSQLPPHSKTQKTIGRGGHVSKVRLDSKGAEADTVSKAQSGGDTAFVRGSPLAQMMKPNQQISGQKGIHLNLNNVKNQQPFNDGISNQIAGSIMSDQSELRKAPSSRLILSQKKQFTTIQQFQPPLLRSRTTANNQNKRSAVVLLGVKSTIKLSNANVQPNSGGKSKRLTSANMQISQRDRAPFSMQDNMATVPPVKLMQVTDGSDPKVINYRAGNFNQRSQNRQKRLISAYAPTPRVQTARSPKSPKQHQSAANI